MKTCLVSNNVLRVVLKNCLKKNILKYLYFFLLNFFVSASKAKFLKHKQKKKIEIIPNRP